MLIQYASKNPTQLSTGSVTISSLALVALDLRRYNNKGRKLAKLFTCELIPLSFKMVLSRDNVIIM